MTDCTFQLRPRDHIGEPATKTTLNRELFTEVAPTYDFITQALSFNCDAVWKQGLIRLIPSPSCPHPACLDLACGTGDITRLLATRFPHGHVVGLDLTPAMLELAQGLTSQSNIRYEQASMAQLPHADASMDVVTGSYALRNAPDLDTTSAEIARVLRPGGHAAFLDFSKAPSPVLASGHLTLLKFWGGCWGLALHGNSDVYGYIADSLRVFPNRRELRKRFDQHGLPLCQSQRYFGGMLELLLFRRTKDAT